MNSYHCCWWWAGCSGLVNGQYAFNQIGRLLEKGGGHLTAAAASTEARLATLATDAA
jgi:hypothetical protein